ncbi:HlyC/CorC family transporter [Breznakiella homolactica]|uniref:HlyC/CorC family transporter n=1 Tax=Breznakiella homolactica TaxID=2798577 RepID=UPI001CBA67FD|nr:hemolysin family protein [Breznakiella homolactica]
MSLGFLLICSAFFSASETAFSSLNKIKLKNLGIQGNKRAMAALELADNYDKLLSSVLIGNNIVNIASSALATVLFVGFFGNMGVTIATVTMTVLVLIFGEISPKTLAKEAPESFAMFSTPVLRVFIIILTPVNKALAVWKSMILKIFRLNTDRSVTEEELITFVEEVRQEGGINAQEEDMIKQAIEFDDLTAGDIFTPRVDVKAIALDDSLEAIEKMFYETGYSRLPVYNDSIDHICGVILQKDFHYQVLKQHKSLEEIIKPMVFIPKNMKVPKLLKAMQEQKSHIAAIVDEYGGTVGIVTIEDIVEELVGDIWDEHDHVQEEIIPLSNDTYKVHGNTDLEDLFELFSLDINEEKTNATTVGSWVMEQLGDIPREGESFVYKNISVAVSKTIRHRVMEVTVSALPETETAAPEDGTHES